ncbi:MAG: glycosyltransferase family 4 protein [Oculatellaceae cyanobacterium Prado106]|jgi:glycosyltransferase involved in cell wall biosynthesis|nr:glycosyltransferase family 4 protein [Oculatellaceae cyanobacterium Prado106]
MKIAYVTTYDARQVGQWGGGTAAFMTQAFQQDGVDVDFVGPLVENHEFLKFKWRIYRHLIRRDFMIERNQGFAQRAAREAALGIQQAKADVILAPIPIPVAYLDCPQPIVTWSDATFAGLLNFYPEFSNLCPETLRDGHRLEQAALDRCHLAIFSSDWAAKTALTHYQVDPAKVKVVCYGTNLPPQDRDFATIKTAVQNRPSDRCNLLFLGVDWVRKGGKMAVEVARSLNQAGLKTTLTVAGCDPLEHPIPDFVRPLGYIPKSSPAGLQQISQLLAESHFLILPSLGDCTPMVFGEANAFGVPCLSTDVGGIPSVIREGYNGKTFPLQADPADYCHYILDLFLHYDQYQDLALSSFQEHESRLNWRSAVKTVQSLLS